jgi:hypothetical protein
VPQSQREAVKHQLLSSMEHGIIDSDWDEDCASSDRRGYSADSEELAEGQVGQTLLQMKDVLRQEGVLLNSVEDEFAEDHYDVVINGERFRIDDTPAQTSQDQSWAISTKRLLEIVNQLLKRAGSTERLYDIYGGNDGRVILLTEDMHQLLGRAPWIHRKWMPYAPDTIEIPES